jgi:hypothetical protein
MKNTKAGQEVPSSFDNLIKSSISQFILTDRSWFRRIETKTPKGADMYKIIIFTLTLFLVACSSTMKMYSGPDLPPSETAIVRCGNISVNIVSCDNRKVTANTLTLLPGEHIVEMSFANKYANSYSSDTAFLKFNARAGRTYSVDYILQGNKYNPFIEDVNTKEKVSSSYLPISKTQERLTVVNRWIEQHPREDGNWREKGELLITLERYEEALSAFDVAQSLKPDQNASFWNLKGLALYRLKRYSEALPMIEKTLQLQPDNEVYKQNLIKVKNAIQDKK